MWAPEIGRPGGQPISPIQIVTTPGRNEYGSGAIRARKTCHPGRMPSRPTSGHIPADRLARRSPERRPVRLEAHGDVRVDDWFWLRDKDDPAVIEHLEAENAYTEAAMAGTGALQSELFDEIVARIEETDLSVPVRKGPLALLQPHGRGQQLRHPLPPAVAPRRADRSAAGPASDRAAGRGRAGHPGREPAGRGARLLRRRAICRSVPTTGGWRTRPTPPAASVSPCASPIWPTGTPSPESIEDTSYGVAWANDNATVFYVRVDEAMRPYQLWRHRVGTRPGHRRPGLRGARRPLLPGGGPDQGRPVRADEPRLEGDLRGPGARRRRPAGDVHGRRAPASGDRVQRRPRPGRPRPGEAEPVPHRHQRRGRGLPADGGPRRLARP